MAPIGAIFYCKKYRYAIFPESRQKKLAECFPFMAGMRAKESMMPFYTLLSLGKKRFTRVFWNRIHYFVKKMKKELEQEIEIC